MSNNIPGLKEINNKDILDQIVYYFTEQKFLKGEYIAKQGDIGKNLYILTSGCVRVECSFNIPRKKLDLNHKPSNFLMNVNLAEC